MINDRKNWWVSWYSTIPLAEFELHWPWWVSGYRADDEAPTVVAAIRADSEMHAKEIVSRAYDKPPADIEWRFCEERPEDWNPYGSDRFPRRKWMPDWPPNLTGPRP